MFSHARLKIDKDLYERARAYAALKKFASVDDFVARLIERELNTVAQADDPEVLKRLEGLGYIE
jgi:hypothetical protein